LPLEGSSAPLSGIALDGEEVFDAVGDAVQGAADFAGLDFFIGLGGLLESKFLGKGGDADEFGAELLEAGEIDLGEFDAGDLSGPDEMAEFGDGEEGDVLVFGGSLEGDFGGLDVDFDRAELVVAGRSVDVHGGQVVVVASLTKTGVASAVVLYVLEGSFEFSRGEFETGDLGEGAEVVEGDIGLRGRVLGLGFRRVGEGGGGKSGGHDAQDHGL